MYQRLSAVLFPILAVLLIGAAFWGYQENQEKNTILIKAENQYQRAFHNLSYDLDQLHSQLGNALAVHSDSKDFQRKSLVNVWRITSEAQNEIGQLPLTLMPFHETEKFLSRIAKFSYDIALRDLGEQPMSAEENKALLELYEHSKEIAANIRKVQSKVLDENLRWMDVEIAMASQEQNVDNMIIDGFKLVDKRVTEYPEVNLGPAQPNMFATKERKLNGKMMTPKEIKEKARDFFQMNPDELKVVENGQGTEYSSYTITMVNEDDRRLKADYSKRGGHLLWFMNQREVDNTALTIDEAVQNAQQFLQQHGFEEMTPVTYDEYNNVVSLVMARKEGEVIIYPEKLTVKVALDNGEVTGLQAVDYVYESKDKDKVLPEPALSADEAKKRLNPNFKVEQQNLVVMETPSREEVLTYEFIGGINGGTYRIYINAKTGKEEQVKQIDQKEIPGS